MKTKSSTKKNDVIEILHERKHANVRVGGKITISEAQARGFYALTQLNPDDKKAYENLLMCRDIVRSMAKAILFLEGESDSPESFINTLMNVPSDNEELYDVEGNRIAKTNTVEAFGPNYGLDEDDMNALVEQS